MEKKTQYTAHKPDKHGFVNYSSEEDAVWEILYERQMGILKDRVCEEYVEGIATLGLSSQSIPQLPTLSKTLYEATGWSLVPVPALISFDRFFELLSKRQFPVATFIRSREELDYLKEPDIFHEVFGHCPMLTHPDFARFTEIYGKLGVSASREERVYLARLYWMTVEFGLVQSSKGLRIYGGGILSSYRETLYAIDSDIPKRNTFAVMDALRTPYRIDILQPVYYIINDIAELGSIIDNDLMSTVREAMKMELIEPMFSASKD